MTTKILNKIKNIALISSFFLLLLIFFAPIWRIEIFNAQYQEGLGLNFYIDKIKEVKKFDLQTINTINKYVGIKKIDTTDFISFFKIFKTCFTFIIIFFLLFIVKKKKKFIKIIISFYFFLLIIILYYFNNFVNIYINNSDKNASLNSIIENFYPPLFSCKDLFNIKICFFPEISIYIIIFNLLIIIIELFSKEIKKENE